MARKADKKRVPYSLQVYVTPKEKRELQEAIRASEHGEFAMRLREFCRKFVEEIGTNDR